MAQNTDSLIGFDYKAALEHARYAKTNKEKADLLFWSKQRYIKHKYFLDKSNISLYNNINQKIEVAACANMDFENNSTSGWIVSGDTKITNGTGVDPFGGFPVVYPGGGKYSLKLNDNNVTNKTNFNAAASRAISVSSSNNYLNLHFALAILNFPHSQSDAAKFKVKIFNAANEVLECPQYDCYFFTDEFGGHAIGTTGFQENQDSLGINMGNQSFKVSYSPWQTVGIDLTPYIGQTITVKISCDWCVYDYDWAYCYFDADCSRSDIPKYTSCGTLPANLVGPSNMKSYVWIAPNGVDTVSKSISCNASVAGLYSLYCIPNLTCEGATLKLVYSTLPEVKVGYITDRVSGFAPLTVNFKDTSVFSPNLFTPSYVWSFGNGISQLIKNNNASTTYTAAGTYTSMLIVFKGGCWDTAYQIITVEMPSKILIPDVFTPNGDGSNDVFFLKTTSLAEVNAQIFDRWGNEVFETKSYSGNIAWDGKNSKGNECAAGTYFYLINAIGSDEKSYAQKGNVSLFR